MWPHGRQRSSRTPGNGEQTSGGSICPPKRRETFYPSANRRPGHEWLERRHQPRRAVPESRGRRYLHRRPGKRSTIARDWKEFKGEPLAVTILENGGKTPWVSPEEMYAMGFNMVLYPTTLLFRQPKAVLRALDDLKAGRPMPKQESVSMMEFEKIVDIAYWKAIEQKSMPLGERVRQTINKLVKKIA